MGAIKIARTLDFIRETETSQFSASTGVSVLELVCLHEAAHAQVAVDLGCSRVSFDVQADKGCNNWIIGGCWWNDNPCPYPKIHVRKLIDIAGYLAECLKLKQDPYACEDKFFETGSCFGGDAKSVGKESFKQYVELGMARVQPRWQDIVEAAEECRRLYIEGAEGWAGLEVEEKV